VKKTTLVLAAAAVMTLAAGPAFAHCGGSYGKAYRSANAGNKPAVANVAKKPAVATAAEPQKEDAPAAATSGLDITGSGFAPGSNV
jgi:hypothetical protein